MLSDDELAVYELAYHLRMPVYRLVSEMTYEEFQGWMDYFERRPVGWRSDDRIFKVLQTQGVKGQPYQFFPSLEPIYKPKTAEKKEGEINMKSFQKSAIFSKLLGAVGGAQIDFGQTEGSSKASEVPSSKGRGEN